MSSALVLSTLLVLTTPAQAAQSWKWAQAGSNTLGSVVRCLAYDGSKLYAGCDNGTVYENALGGGAWAQTGTNPPGATVYSLAYDGSKLYAGCGNGTVYENALGGGAWSPVGTNPPGFTVMSLAYDGSKLYAGCTNGTVYGNALGGGAWSQVGGNLGSSVYSLACDGSKLYAGCANGTVYENALGGGAWAQTGTNAPGSPVFSLAYSGSKLYAGCDNGTVYGNALGGGAWSQVGGNLGSPVRSLAYEGSLYAGCDNGTVYENTLDGGAWSQCGTNTPGSRVNSLACDGSKLYTGCFNQTVYEMKLLWKWAQTGSDTPEPNVFALAYDGSKLYAGCFTGTVYENALGGGAWVRTGSNTPGPVRALAYDGSKLYAGCWDGVVYENALVGGAWTQCGSNTPGANVYSLAYDGSKLYAGCWDGVVYENALGGGAWTQCGSNTPGSTVLSLAYDGSKLYAGCSNGTVYENTLVGGAWTQTGSNTLGSAVVGSLACVGTRLYAGCWDGVVYENALVGGAWTQCGSNTPGSAVFSLACDGSKLYAGCGSGSNGTVYQNTLVGGAWSQSASNTPGSIVNALSYSGSKLYAGCYNGTIYELDKAYDIDASAPGGNGSVDPVGQEVIDGANATIYLNPNTGYHTASVTDGGTPVTPIPTTQYEISNVTGSHEVVATFAINTYRVTASVSGGGGTVSPGSQDVNYGGSSTININPATGYHTASITDNGTLVTPTPSTSYTVNTVTANHTITATFAPNPPMTGSTWYLAEGTTAWGFGTYISITNPGPVDVHAAVTYMTGAGNVSGGTITLPAESQTTVNPSDMLGNKDFSTRVTCTEGKTIAVDRTMSWTGPGAVSPEGHSSVGVTAPARTWYLPEGCSAFGFETWLLIQNPNATTATASVTYMIEGGAPVTKTHTVPGNSRQSFNMETDIGQKNASIKVVSNIPVIPERAMYRNNKREGHDSIGTTNSASDYYLAEGTTAWGFTTWVLIQNPTSTPSDVTITYMTPSGKKAQAPFTLPGNSRKTIKVNDVAGMANTDFSTQVHGSSPIIAERSMYWDNGTGEACHDSIGMDQAHTTFYLPDGQTSGGHETWTLVQNPNASAVNVEISYLNAGGGAVTLTKSIPANSRMTFNMADKITSGRASIMVTAKNGKKIMVERAMYWNNKGAGTDTIGGFSD